MADRILYRFTFERFRYTVFFLIQSEDREKVIESIANKLISEFKFEFEKVKARRITTLKRQIDNHGKGLIPSLHKFYSEGLEFWKTCQTLKDYIGKCLQVVKPDELVMLVAE